MLLVVIGSYLTTRSVLFEGVVHRPDHLAVGGQGGPGADVLAAQSREFVDLARLSGKRPLSIIVREIAPNMASYLFLVVILLFGSSMLLAASYDFLGLGPSQRRLARLR